MKNIAIIYDLDETILPTRTIPFLTFEPIFDAIAIANDGFLAKSLLHKAFNDLWRYPIDIVATNYGFTDVMINAGKNALVNTDYKLTLIPFDDFYVIKKINCKRFLVTTGITKLQQAKISALFNNEDFEEIIIDDPYHENRLGKKNIFAQIAERYALKPEQVWIIGDNPDSEIAAGNSLGMVTVQIVRPGIERTNKATHTINTFHELKAMIDKL